MFDDREGTGAPMKSEVAVGTGSIGTNEGAAQNKE